MGAPLTGLGSRAAIPELPRCACGCRRPAYRGFPGDIHYATGCIPPAMRFPWEAGYVPPTIAVALPSAASPSPTADDLFSGRGPA